MPVVNAPQSIGRFGIAYGDTTPPAGIYHRMWGAARHERATGVHRPLRTTAAVFGPAAGNESAADLQILLAVDHCILGPRELQRIVEAVTERADVDASQVAVVCSHTHAAGLLSLDRADLPGGELIPGYLDDLARACGELAAEAQAAMQPATIVYGAGRCDLAAHRDFYDEAGGRYVVGFDPQTEADDTVLVARVESDAGNVLATIVNYACHPTTLAWDNTLISPDFPGAMREVVEEATGAPCLFLQGASGELGPREGFVGDTAVADRNGRQLGYAALSTLAGLAPGRRQFVYTGAVESGAVVGTWEYRPLGAEEEQGLQSWAIGRETIALPYRTDLMPLEAVQAELERLEQAESASAGDDSPAAEETRARAERRRRELSRRKALPAGDCYPWRAVLWRMGDAVWLCVQGEPYSLLQTALRERFPETPIVVASIAFSWDVSYLPPRECYEPPRYQSRIAILAPGSLEQAIDVLSRRIEELMPGKQQV